MDFDVSLLEAKCLLLLFFCNVVYVCTSVRQ